jgi:hypothetical protein
MLCVSLGIWFCADNLEAFHIVLCVSINFIKVFLVICKDHLCFKLKSPCLQSVTEVKVVNLYKIVLCESRLVLHLSFCLRV